MLMGRSEVWPTRRQFGGTAWEVMEQVGSTLPDLEMSRLCHRSPLWGFDEIETEEHRSREELDFDATCRSLTTKSSAALLTWS
jgi:hypothetical protein